MADRLVLRPWPLALALLLLMLLVSLFWAVDKQLYNQQLLAEQRQLQLRISEQAAANQGLQQQVLLLQQQKQELLRRLTKSAPPQPTSMAE
ncbi:hypothetical protein [Ferrimonas senticii]|uniref:hypothetical protein n=1 Tax=Ferrimonas senticii TaxID=394566 RepID=UPI000410D730|nr:hypothetical protein [Ferrimonas senticii]